MNTNQNIYAAQQVLPPGVLLSGCLILIVGGLGPNFLLACFAVAVLIAGSALVWRPGEPPIFFVILIIQWLQTTLSIFHATWLGIDVADYPPFQGEQVQAIVLSLLSLVCLCIGLRMGAGRVRWEDRAAAQQIVLSQPNSRWFWLFAQAWVLAFFAQAGAWIIPGLSQILLAFAGLKWAFFMMLAYATFTRKGDSKSYFYYAFAFELGLGIGGFFSDFKTVFAFTFMAFLMSGARLSARGIVSLGAMGAFVIGLGITWTAVKNDYRGYIGGGSASQAVEVGYIDRMQKLAELVESIDYQAFGSATDQFMRRLSYVEFFGAVLTVVPRSIPHENGAIWIDAISRPFMPRLFFSDKAVIDDSVRTNVYTGGLTGTSDATSISLGYIAEAYIDFGEYAMMLPILAIGYFYGRIYRLLREAQLSRGLLGMSLASAILFPAAFSEGSITKVFGGIIVAFISAFLILRIVVPFASPWAVLRRQ